MKISIGSKIVEGPWGGGNLFAINLTNFLSKLGHDVIYDLSEPDIDFVKFSGGEIGAVIFSSDK